MIDFEGYYFFPAEEVGSVHLHTVTGEYPYALTVHLKSGRDHTINYKEVEGRNKAARNLRSRIEMDLRETRADVRNALFLLNDEIKRIDKRQLRIWQQLKRLLNIKGQEDAE